MTTPLYEQVLIRKAVIEDLAQIKNLASKDSRALGFVLRSALARGIEERRVFVVEFDDQLIGFQEYYHRLRDLQTTLYHKCVAADFRRRGIGTRLVDEVVRESKEMGRHFLLLKCPQDLLSNKFHRSYGFTLAGVENGRRRRLNIWRYDLL